MFRDMRRFRQLLSEEETEEILRRNTVGVLSVLGDDDYPYGVPIAYLYHDGKLYFHTASQGHKMDSIRKHNKVSFAVVDADDINEERFTTYFRSAIAFGRMRELTSPEETEEALFLLSTKYSPSIPEDVVRAHAKKASGRPLVIVMDIDHMTGKEAIELVMERNK